MIFGKKGESAVVAKIADAPAQYREMAQRLHALVRENAPTLEPVLRWGIPFYARDGKDVCYIKFGEDFLVFGFGESLNPAVEDNQGLHPVVWNVTALDESAIEYFSGLLKKVA